MTSSTPRCAFQPSSKRRRGFPSETNVKRGNRVVHGDKELLPPIYSQRLSAQRTKSRVGKIVGTPANKSMTIRSWQTTMALLERMEAPEAKT